MHIASRRTLMISAVLLLLVTTLFWVPNATYAQGPQPGGKLVFGGTYTLASGETLYGDLLVMGGAVTIQTDATVNGDVAIIGGNATIDGYIYGDVVAIGGAVNLGPNAVVDGDATAVGGIIQRDPNASVHGNIVETDGVKRENFIGKIGPGGIPLTPGAPEAPGIPEGFEGEFNNFPTQRTHHGPFAWLFDLFLDGMSAIAWTAILAALGVVLVLIAPRPTERVANAIQHNLLLSFGVGLAAFILLTPAIMILILILAITICLIPLAVAIPFILLAILLFGWLAMGWMVGKELLKAANASNATPVWEAIVGVAILTLLWRLPQMLPFVGGLLSLLIFSVIANIAVGGVLLTRFGRQDYPSVPKDTTMPPLKHALPEESSLTAESEQNNTPITPPPPPLPDE